MYPYWISFTTDTFLFFFLLQLIKVQLEFQDSLISLLLKGADLRKALKLIIAGLICYRWAGASRVCVFTEA